MANHAAGKAARPGAPGLQPVGLALDRRAQLGDARAVLAVGADKVADARKLLLQAAAVQVERLFVDFVEHDNDGRAAAEAVDQLESVFGVHIDAPPGPRSPRRRGSVR